MPDHPWGRPWTLEENNYLRQNYRQQGPAACAAHLGRTRVAVRHRASFLGIVHPHRRTSVLAETIQRMHAAGHDDHDIGAALGLTSRAVGYHRGRLGLPAQSPNNPRWRAKVQEGVRASLSRHGVSRLIDLHRLGQVALCHARGWPGATSERQADILDALVGGPITRPEILARIGAHGRNAAYKTLQRLQLVGLIVREGIRYRLADDVHPLGAKGVRA